MRSAEMKHTTERRLMRLLHGELPPDEAKRLEQRLAGDAELRAAYERLAAKPSGSGASGGGWTRSQVAARRS